MNKKVIKDLLIRAVQKEDYIGIRDFLIESSNLYPGIENWWDRIVLPDVELGKRIILVVDTGNSFEGLFIGKPGNSAKLCTLRLRESVRNMGVGRALVTEGLSRLLLSTTTSFHVTISEAAEEGAKEFFESIGFQRIAVKRNRYRNGVDEFIYSCTKNEMIEVINNDLSQGIERTLYGIIPKQIPKEQTLLMSLKPEYAEKMLRGEKTIEFRRRFSKKYKGATILFYVTHPIKKFMFTARVDRVDHATKEKLWNSYKEEGGISEITFHKYFSGTDGGYAIQVSDLKAITNQLVLDEAKKICPQLRPPQSFQKIKAESPLLQALNIPINI